MTGLGAVTDNGRQAVAGVWGILPTWFQCIVVGTIFLWFASYMLRTEWQGWKKATSGRIPRSHHEPGRVDVTPKDRRLAHGDQG